MSDPHYQYLRLGACIIIVTMAAFLCAGLIIRSFYDGLTQSMIIAGSVGVVCCLIMGKV